MKILIQGDERRCSFETAESKAIKKAEAALRLYGTETKSATALAAADAIAAFLSGQK